MPVSIEERDAAREQLRAQARSNVAARAGDREMSGGSNWDNLLHIANPLTIATGLIGLGQQAAETSRSVAEMPGTLVAGLAGRAQGLSDEEIAAQVRDIPGAQWLANEEMYDPVDPNGGRRARFGDMFPLFDFGVSSFSNTVGRATNPSRYKDEWDQGTLPMALMEDVLNVSMFAAPFGRALRGTGAAAEGGAVAATAATRAAAPIRAADAALSRAISPAVGARMATVGSAVEQAARLGERGAFVPAWPVRALRAPGRRLVAGGDAAFVAARDGATLSAGQRTLVPVGSAMNRARAQGDRLWATRRTQPIVQQEHRWMGEFSDLLGENVVPLRRAEALVPDPVGQQAVMFAGSGGLRREGASVTAEQWRALPEDAQAQLFDAWRDSSRLDMTREGFERGLDYAARNLDPELLGLMDEAHALVRDTAGGALATWEQAGRGVNSLQGRTTEQQAYVDANLDNQPLDPFVDERVARDHQSGIDQAQAKVVKLMTAFGKRMGVDVPDAAPKNVGGVRVPNVVAPDPSFRRYDIALERALRLSDREEGLAGKVGGKAATGSEGVYTGSMDRLHASHVKAAERDASRPPPVDADILEVPNPRISWREDQAGAGRPRVQRGELEEALDMFNPLREEAAQKAKYLDSDIRQWGGRIPFIPRGWIEGKLVEPVSRRTPGYGMASVDEIAHINKLANGDHGVRDAFYGMPAGTLRLWRRGGEKFKDHSKLQVEEWLGLYRDLHLLHPESTWDDVVAHASQQLHLAEDLRLVSYGSSPGQPYNVAGMIGSKVDTQTLVAILESLDDTSYRGREAHMAAAFKRGLGDKRVVDVAARVAEGLRDQHQELIDRYGDEVGGYRWDLDPVVAPLTVEQRMSASSQRVWDAYNHDFVVGMKSREGYGVLSGAEKGVYDAFATDGKWQKARHMTKKQREVHALRRQELLDGIAESVGRQTDKAQASVDSQAARRARTAKGEGIREGASYGRRLEQRRRAVADMRDAQKDLNDRVALRDADRAARVDAGEALPAAYRPLLVRNKAFVAQTRIVADDFASNGDSVTADLIRGLGDEVVSAADEIMGAFPQGQHPMFMAGGSITRGETGSALQSGQTPQVRASSAQHAKSGETVPMTFRGQAVVRARRLRVETTNKVASEIADLDPDGVPRGWATRPVEALGLDQADAAGAPTQPRTGQQILDDMTEWADRLEQHPNRNAPAGYRWVPWDPVTPFEGVPVAAVNERTLFVPEPMAQLFKAEFRDPRSWEQTIYKWLDKPVGLWKDQVLAFSPKWHMGNLVGGLMLGSTAGGVNPLDLVRSFATEWRRAAPEPLTGRAGPLEGRRRAQWDRAQQINAADGGLPTELFWGGGIDHGLRRYTRDIEVVDPARGTIRPEAAMYQRRQGRYRRATDWSYGLNQRVDDAVRAAIYTAQEGKGMAADDALRLAMASMPDFRLLPYEQQWMRRVFPFYAWAKHMTKVSYRLSRDHPMRVAWGLRIGQEFTSDLTPSDIPGLSSAVPFLGGFINAAWMNPYGDIAPLDPAGIGSSSSPSRG